MSRRTMRFRSLTLVDVACHSLGKSCANLKSSSFMDVNHIGLRAKPVENEAQLQLLRQFDIDGVQGFYSAHPLTVEECEKCLKDNLEKGIQ